MNFHMKANRDGGGSAGMQKPLMLISLNEINFDLVSDYNDVELPNLRKIASGAVRTTSEARYDLLEPWIQWVSVYSGLTAEEHGIYRLGDCVETGVPQIFETLEQRGFRVGAISPMNAANRLKNPVYFIPDPWTATPADPSAFSQKLARAMAQLVNDNAKSTVTLDSALTMAMALIRFAKPRNYLQYLSLAFGAVTSKKWKKALLFDLFLSDLHTSLTARKNVDFSSVFFNAGAHIQHHYMLSARRFADQNHNPPWYVRPGDDPVLDMLKVYDRIAGQALNNASCNALVVTGLTQAPYPHTTYYWRLREHGAFLDALQVRYRSVHPRMTRDFLITFDTVQEALDAQAILQDIVVDGGNEPLFGEIDNRGDSLFVTLTYPEDVTDSTTISLGSKASGPMALKPHLAFVAIKNGHHDGRGFAYFDWDENSDEDIGHVKNIYNIILEYFDPAAALEDHPHD